VESEIGNDFRNFTLTISIFALFMASSTMDSLRLIGTGGLRLNENQAQTDVFSESRHDVAIHVAIPVVKPIAGAHPDTSVGILSGSRV
jgi:hypothetical protein